MGQYYKPYLCDLDGNEKAFCAQNAMFMTVHGLTSSNEIEGHPKRRSWDWDDVESWGSLFSGLKLMEHSWLKNDFVNGVVEFIEGNPCHVAWVGDYADCEGDFDGRYTEDVYRKVWPRDGDDGLPESPFAKSPEVHVDGYLVNIDKDEYLDLEKYAERSTVGEGDWAGYCVHPLPLLTAIGNGRGGGDYWERHPNADLVGYWAMDEIEYLPKGSELEGFVEVDYSRYMFNEED